MKEIMNPHTATSTEQKTEDAPASNMVNLNEWLQCIYDGIWEPLLCSDYFSDVVQSESNNEYQILGVLGELYVRAEDIALNTGQNMLDILDRCGHGNELYYPEPNLPLPLKNAAPGTYVPLSSGLRLIPSCGDCYYDKYELITFRDEFQRRKNEGLT